MTGDWGQASGELMELVGVIPMTMRAFFFYDKTAEREAGLELGSAVGLSATLIVKSQGRYEEAHGADECMDEGEERDEKAGPYK